MMTCECCGGHIATGSQYVTFHGRPWIPAHVIEYKKRRALVASGGRT